MTEENRVDNDNVKLARAKAALSNQESIDDWKKNTDELTQRLAEAAKELTSDEQKKKQQEEERLKIERLKNQKRLAQLEETRRQAEEQKRQDFANKQRQQDELVEKERQAKVRQISEAQIEIDQIKQQSESGLSPIRTFTRDAGAAIKDENLSAAKIAMTKQPRDYSKETKQTPTWLIGLSVILILGSLIIGLSTIIQKRLLSQAPLTENRIGLLTVNKQIEFNLEKTTKEELKNQLTALLADKKEGESLTEIYFTVQKKENTEQGSVFYQVEADPDILNTYLNLNLPDNLLRFLSPEMMIGVYSGKTNAPFFIFKTTDYANVAAIWLDQENQIIAELFSLFDDQLIINKINNGFSQDKMIRNHDTRLIIDEENNLLALSAWLDKNTLLITNNEETFAKILNTYLN